MASARDLRFLVAVFASVAVACTPTTPSPPAPAQGKPAAQATPAPTPTAALSLSRQNTLVVATPEDVVSLDPPVGGNDTSSDIAWQTNEMAINYVFAKQGDILVQQGDKTEP